MIEEYQNLLKPYLAFKSISTDLSYKKDMLKTANWLEQLFKKQGYKTKQLKGKITNPVIFASYVVSKELPTVLIYGHYDVQPASGVWKSNPFILTKRSGRLYGRGVVDNKGQSLIHIVAINNLIQKKQLGFNIKFLIEGNEETGNSELPQLLKENKELLKADTILISDGEITGDNPTIEASLRGGFNMKVVVQTGKTDLHSGIYGGAVPSASHELGKLLSSFHTKSGKIAITDFYKNAPTISKQKQEFHKKIQDDREILKTAQVSLIKTETGKDFFSQVGLCPTLQISGIQSGYTGEGFANIVPAKAEVRINVRLVGNQKPKEVYAAISKHIKKQSPSYVKVIITKDDFSDPVAIDVHQKKFKEIAALLEKAYAKKPIVKHVGGGIPIVSDFKKIFKTEPLLVSLGNDDCNMHGIDENFKIDLIKKGLNFSTLFFRKNTD